jgi:hypothetical protein
MLNDPSSSGRWSDATLISFYNQAASQLVRDVEFPQSRIIGQTIMNQQEYPLPEFIRIIRVYVAGQLVVPTSLQVLEGHQIEVYDQGQGDGISQTVPATGSGGPPGVVPGFAPGWVVQSPASYPVSNSWGPPAPSSQVWFNGQRPRYYFRGGSIGLVPAPSGIVDIVIEGLRVPTPVINLTDAIPFPFNYGQALAWKVCELAKFSDDDDRAADQRNYAAQQYEIHMRRIRQINKSYDGDGPRRPNFRTYRGFYYKGNNRNAGTWPEYP